MVLHTFTRAALIYSTELNYCRINGGNPVENKFNRFHQLRGNSQTAALPGCEKCYGTCMYHHILLCYRVTLTHDIYLNCHLSLNSKIILGVGRGDFFNCLGRRVKDAVGPTNYAEELNSLYGYAQH